jgi:general secretion pathway protein B
MATWPSGSSLTAVAPRPVPPKVAEPQPAKPPAATMSNVVPRDQLPADVQSKLPPLALSGSVYSPNPKNRMVIVDGRLVIEGEQAAQGLVVERIHPKSVVMRFLGHRFEVPLS